MNRYHVIIAWILIVSIVTYLVYAIDKHAAIKGRWRIPEAQLHLLALCGGWPGAWMAQRTLRHKSVKRSFRLVFRLTVLLNCTILAGLLYTARFISP